MHLARTTGKFRMSRVSRAAVFDLWMLDIKLKAALELL